MVFLHLCGIFITQHSDHDSNTPFCHLSPIMSPTNFTSYKAALDNSTNTPARPGRVRTRTAKGAFYGMNFTLSCI